jgi:uncharacterized membrane protein YdbT with pleckstrin-like domain
MAIRFAMFAKKLYQVDPMFTIALTTGIVVYLALRFNIKENNLNLNQKLLIRKRKKRYVPAVDAVNFCR